MPSFQQKELQSILKDKEYSLKKQTKHQNQIQIQIQDQILKLSDWRFSVTRMHMLRALSSHQRTRCGGLTVIRPPHQW